MSSTALDMSLEDLIKTNKKPTRGRGRGRGRGGAASKTGGRGRGASKARVTTAALGVRKTTQKGRGRGQVTVPKGDVDGVRTTVETRNRGAPKRGLPPPTAIAPSLRQRRRTGTAERVVCACVVRGRGGADE